MISANIYYTVYLIGVLLLTLMLYHKYNAKNGTAIAGNKQDTHMTTLLLTVSVIIFIGLRPLSGKYFGDMLAYEQTYHTIHEGTPFSFKFNTNNLIFDNYFAWVGSMELGTTFFFTTIAAIYFGCMYFAVKRLFPQNTLAAYACFLAAFSTFSYGTNGIKAGAAASIYILAISYRHNLKVCIPLLLVSWGFHHSMQLPLICFVITMLYKNTKVYMGIWCLSCLIAALHITSFQYLFAGLTSERGASYLTTIDDWGGKSGFRLDFVIYSAMPIFAGYYAIFKKKIQISKLYNNFLNLYLITNSIWMLCMYAEFTNRIAYLSWFLYPVVLIYPFLNEKWGPNRYKIFSKVMAAHLGFTIFMKLIYYA